MRAACEAACKFTRCVSVSGKRACPASHFCRSVGNTLARSGLERSVRMLPHQVPVCDYVIHDPICVVAAIIALGKGRIGWRVLRIVQVGALHSMNTSSQDWCLAATGVSVGGYIGCTSPLLRLQVRSVVLLEAAPYRLPLQSWQPR